MHVSFAALDNMILIGYLVIARALKKMQEEQMKNRDKRTRLMTELLNNIKRFLMQQLKTVRN